MLARFAALLAVAGLASAWLPHDRDMTTSADGSNLFTTNATAVHDRNGMKRWLSGKLPIRGVNLGSLFIVEQWMASTEWSNMGCGSTATEFDCTVALGQATANTNFQKHWASWITKADIQKMASYGLNTIRIPVGYWIFKDLKYPSEHFPEGQLAYLDKVCGWASDAGLYIIIDLHGAPFGQASNAFTGQMASPPTESNLDFYQTSQYQRALWFLGNLTEYVHRRGGTTGAYRNVGMLEVVNEPISEINSLTTSMREQYYPDAFTTIRAVEKHLNIPSARYLHVQMMNKKWNSGDPTEYLTATSIPAAAYDDHRYLKWDPSVTVSQAGYLAASCADDRGGDAPTIVGEWSLSVSSDVENSDPQFHPVADNVAFYGRWFNAQVRAYEKQAGWVFWSWKTAGLGDPRWDYQLAVAAGIIPKNLGSVYSTNPCS